MDIVPLSECKMPTLIVSPLLVAEASVAVSAWGAGLAAAGAAGAAGAPHAATSRDRTSSRLIMAGKRRS
jgi:hypothetical protein